MSFKVVNLTSRIGTEIKADRADLLNGRYKSQIRQLLEQRGVLVFRKVHFTDEEQVQFAATLGGVVEEGENGIYKVALQNKDTSDADYLRATYHWHFDSFHEDRPTLTSILIPRRLSEAGGQTEFANTYAGYEDLPEAQKNEIDQIKVVHSLFNSMRTVYPEPTKAQIAVWCANRKGGQGIVHPLVWHHQSGRNSLLLGMTAGSVVGMGIDEGYGLLCELREMTTQPKYVYQHEWELGDVVIWDNTGTLHRVVPYPIESGRLMHRTKLAGEEPIR